MSERKNNAVTVRAASGSVRRVVRRSIFALAALAALVFVPAGPSRAQAQSTPSKSAQVATAKPVAELAPTKGQREGINVHGWWTIEVRNPDGKVISHTEFENTLVQPLGANELVLLLTGQQVVGGYRITMGDTPTLLTGPCQGLGAGAITSCFLIGSLTNPTPTTFHDLATGCPGVAGQCFPLSITTSQTSITVGGTAISAAASGQITDVSLEPIICADNAISTPLIATNISPSTCAASTGTAGTLTHATLPTPVPIPAAGQSIAVTVQLSFQ